MQSKIKLLNEKVQKDSTKAEEFYTRYFQSAQPAGKGTQVAFEIESEI